MKINTFEFLLVVLFAVSSLNNAWTDDDDSFHFDAKFDPLTTPDNEFDPLTTPDNEFDPLTTFDEDIDALSEFETNKHKHCRVKNDHYPNKQCRKDSCSALCRKEQKAIDGKCRKSKNDKVKKCYCYIDCNHNHHIAPPTSPPAVSPAPSVSPVYPPSGSPSPTPSPSTSPVVSPVNLPSSPAPEQASSLDTPCDDSDVDVTPPPKKTNGVGEFSDEDFDFIFS